MSFITTLESVGEHRQLSCLDPASDALHSVVLTDTGNCVWRGWTFRLLYFDEFDTYVCRLNKVHTSHPLQRHSPLHQDPAQHVVALVLPTFRVPHFLRKCCWNSSTVSHSLRSCGVSGIEPWSSLLSVGITQRWGARMFPQFTLGTHWMNTCGFGVGDVRTPEQIQKRCPRRRNVSIAHRGRWAGPRGGS